MKKDLLIVFAVVLVLALVCFGLDIQSVDEYYLAHLEDISPGDATVTLSIRCDAALENAEKLPQELREGNYLPADGVILPQTQYVLREGDTVFDVLYRAVRHERIQFEYQGGSANAFQTAYVQGIGYLYEFSCGEASGWVYLVNGQQPGKGCSAYTPADGDRIEWVYTCNLGQDVGGAAA